MIWLLVMSASCTVVPAVAPVAPTAVETPAVVLSDREQFAHAYRLVEAGRYEEARPIFVELTGTYPQLADYHLFFRGLIDARLGDVDAAEVALTHMLAQYPQSAKVYEASLELGKVMLRKQDYTTSTTFLERALATPDNRVGDAARLALAEVAERKGDPSAAFSQLMSIRRDAAARPAGREAKKAAIALLKRYPQLAPSGIALVGEVKLLLDERDYVAASSAVDQLSQAPPRGVAVVEVLTLQAETQLGRGRLDEGLATLWTIADDYPRNRAAPAALFRLASLLWNRDRDAAALRAFAELRRRYPSDRRVPDAMYATARIYQAAGQETDAVSAYQEVIRRFPRHDLAAESKWRIGWIHYGAKRWEEATIVFADLANSTRGKRHDEAMYWRARSHENAGRRDRARQLYEQIVASDDDAYGAYYAAWAQTRLLRMAGAPEEPFAMQPSLQVAVPAASEPEAPPSVPAFHLERFRELRAAGLNHLARGELTAIDRQSGGDVAVARFLIEAYESVDGFRRARSLAASQGRRAGLSAAARQRLAYPLGFWTVVENESRRRQIDPLWIVSIIRQESMFDPEARSPADARGLMQLLPSTAARIAKQYEPEETRDLDLTRPALNVRLGTAYVRDLLDRFDGNVLKVVAAYNGGEVAVERWQTQFGTLDADEFVESITYRETRDYVKRVGGNYRRYRQLYVDEPGA